MGEQVAHGILPIQMSGHFHNQQSKTHHWYLSNPWSHPRASSLCQISWCLYRLQANLQYTCWCYCEENQPSSCFPCQNHCSVLQKGHADSLCYLHQTNCIMYFTSAVPTHQVNHHLNWNGSRQMCPLCYWKQPRFFTSCFICSIFLAVTVCCCNMY